MDVRQQLLLLHGLTPDPNLPPDGLLMSATMWTDCLIVKKFFAVSPQMQIMPPVSMRWNDYLASIGLEMATTILALNMTHLWMMVTTTCLLAVKQSYLWLQTVGCWQGRTWTTARNPHSAEQRVMCLTSSQCLVWLRAQVTTHHVVQAALLALLGKWQHHAQQRGQLMSHDYYTAVPAQLQQEELIKVS